MAGLQDAFDLVPRVAVGRRGRTPYAVTSVVGLVAALAASVAVGAVVGLSGLSVLAMWGAAVVGLAAASGLRWLITQHNSQVALEQIWAVLAAVAGAMWLLDGPVLGGLDVAVVGCAVMQGIGRIGCAMTGCCYGRPSGIGLRYGAAHGRLGLPAVVLGVATFPVALVESFGLGGIAFVTAAATVLGPDGAGLVAYLVLAGGLRFLVEAVRGDVRPEIAGVSAPRWMAGIQALAGIALAGWLPRELPPAAAAAGAVAVGGAALAVATLAWQFRAGGDPLARPVVTAARDAIRSARARVDGVPQATRLAAGVTVVVSSEAPVVHVSISAAEVGPATLGELAARALDGLAVTAAWVSTSGVLHLAAVPRDRGRWRAVSWRRTEIEFGRARGVGAHDRAYFVAA